MLEINGSYGEGGGQILRTALSLSCLLRRPCRIVNIRRARKKPGLMPQHLACVSLLTLISNAKVSGTDIGSTEMTFDPGEPVSGDYFFDIGTAGSTSLLLQAVLPPLIFARGPSRIALVGGTHVPFSPPYHFISEIFLPMLGRLGIIVSSSIERHGFYPRGGGKISVTLQPCRKVKAISLEERGDIVSVTGISAVGNLPASIADRQKSAAEAVLAGIPSRPEIAMKTVMVDSYSPGTFVFLKAESRCISGFSSLGEQGKRAEAVGEEAARELLRHLDTGACIDSHLADQLVIYLCLAGGASKFTTSRISGHLMTNLRVIRQFLDISCKVEGELGKSGRVAIIP